MNNSENQATDVNSLRSSNESDGASPSNANDKLISDQNNQDMFKDWCEEDGDFEVDEAIQQGDHHETQPVPPSQKRQSAQLESVDNVNGGFDFNDEMINSGQISSLNDDETTNKVVGGQKQNDEEIEASQSSTTNNNNDDTNHSEEDLDDMMTDEIGKTNIGNLYDAQNSEVPVQSVLIDQKDVVTLEDEITKSQSPEKVQKSKQSPQKGKKKGAKKSKADTESSTAEGTKSSPIKNKNDQDDDDDQDDQLDPDNDPKTKSGRKIQRPEYFNPTKFGRGRRKSSFEPLANESSRKTKKQTGKRRKNKGKDANASQESENLLSDPNNPSGIFVDAEEDNIVCVICRDGSSAKQNWIVFCDKCNAPYHQRCHKPRIEDVVVEDSQTEWICAKCKASPRSNKRIKVDKNPEAQENNDDKEPGQELISSIGAVLTREQKVEYLSSLSQDVLVNLLLLAEQIEPNIPLYPANILGKYATANMSPKDNEMDETNQEGLTVDVQASKLPTADTSNLSTLDTSPNLNPVNIDYVPPQIPVQDTQQEPITPEASPPLTGLKEITEHSKDSYLSLYIRAMSEIGNPNGSTAQTMHSWIKSNYNVPENFAARAKKALNFAVSKGIFVKNSRMTYKFNPEYAIPYNKDSDANETEDEVKNVEVNVNNNEYDGQKTAYKELTSGLEGEEEIPGIGKQSSSEIKDFNFYSNQDFYLDSMLDANFLGKSDDTYTATTQSQRSSLSNAVNVESNNNPITGQYSSSSDKPPPSSTQSQPITSVPKLPANAQMMINNEQARSDIRLPPLAPKPPINALPSIMRNNNNTINFQSSHQNELLASSIGGGGNDFSYSIIQPTQITSKKQILLLPRVNNNDNNIITRNITTTTSNVRNPNYSILMPAAIRGNQQQQQMYDNAKIRTPSSSNPSLQSLPTIDTSLNGNVNKIRTQQMISIQSSTMHNTPTSIPTSPQQTWPSSFTPFYMSPQPGDTPFAAMFDNTFYDSASQQPQHHQQHSSTASTNDYNGAVLNDLQHNNDNGSLFHRMSGNQQQDNFGEWEYRNI